MQKRFFKHLVKDFNSCETAGHLIPDHFVDVNKTIAMPKGTSKKVPDFMLSRCACHLIARKPDPYKEAIAFVQRYLELEIASFHEKYRFVP